VILSGGNVDPLILTRAIEKAMVTDGRLCRFTAVVADRPGGLARLTQLIAQSGASIEEIVHDRAFSGPDIGQANVLCTVETTDRHHVEELYKLLAEEGISATPLRFATATSPAEPRKETES
jgi:threonine dehydratase